MSVYHLHNIYSSLGKSYKNKMTGILVRKYGGKPQDILKLRKKKKQMIRRYSQLFHAKQREATVKNKTNNDTARKLFKDRRCWEVHGFKIDLSTLLTLDQLHYDAAAAVQVMTALSLGNSVIYINLKESMGSQNFYRLRYILLQRLNFVTIKIIITIVITNIMI